MFLKKKICFLYAHTHVYTSVYEGRKGKVKVNKFKRTVLKKTTGVFVSPSIVRRQLNSVGLKGCVAFQKFLLRKGKRRKKEKHLQIKQRSCCCSQNNGLTNI